MGIQARDGEGGNDGMGWGMRAASTRGGIVQVHSFLGMCLVVLSVRLFSRDGLVGVCVSCTVIIYPPTYPPSFQGSLRELRSEFVVAMLWSLFRSGHCLVP